MGMNVLLRASLATMLFGLPAMAGLAELHAEDKCVSWSEARAAGLTEKFKLRSAPEIKADVEKRYGGKVVSFHICREADDLIYKLAVFKSDGKVLFVTEPAEPADQQKMLKPESGK
jgi:uncharacterized membrane protein YkoI